MTELHAQWRSAPRGDAILVVDERQTVRAAMVADEALLRRFLTELGDLATWQGPKAPEGVDLLPEAWGEMVMVRAASGEVLAMDPERFWDGIYQWYRSKGVDYDSVTPLRRSDAARA